MSERFSFAKMQFLSALHARACIDILHRDLCFCVRREKRVQFLNTINPFSLSLSGKISRVTTITNRVININLI